MTNGSDEALPNLLAHGAAEALARGWNVFLFDGPGQQSMLFDQNVPFRYDWEAVLTPVIDALIERPDVDASALTGYGVSQGGYWVTRAIAFERRLVAAVADPGCVDVSESWTQHLAPPVAEMLESGQKDAFNAAMAKATANPTVARTLAFRSKPYGASDPFDLFTEVKKYQVRDVVGQVSDPITGARPRRRTVLAGPARAALPNAAGRESDHKVHPGRRGELPLPAPGPSPDRHSDARLAARPSAHSVPVTQGDDGHEKTDTARDRVFAPDRIFAPDQDIALR